ncbi:MBL fold metallo-hydrolase [Leptospira langatensis]|uniref:MBL fold metallo-hydrolase n=1 Tax=Leptospira langatensis TaxID=2484983 RepID=A0A5F1ZR60_9LEPT|nr:MBL fold metallo-hydrolase [Leptospira langatensis]TGJ99024.1 MBL fold metallo-hydrolase [Leptospira langatensis]TGL40407.1 MBL fold metallo-hydrolase [Leptospira langatensis]
MHKHRQRIFFWAFFTIYLSICANCFLGAPLKKDAKSWSKDATRDHTPKTWEEVFSKPTRLEITALLTGYVLTGPAILIDAKDPKTPEDQKKEQWVPSLSYLVKHPRRGYFLLDSGVPSIDTENRCDFSLIGPLFNIQCKSEKGRDTASQLDELNIPNTDLDFVLASHLHWDHIGGMEALRKRGPIRVLLSEEEARDAGRNFAVFHGYSHKALSFDFEVSTLPKSGFIDMPILGQVYDLYGDGSVWIVSAHGHTEGEIAVLLNSVGGPILFTFDSSHLKAGFQNGVPPGATVDRKKSLETLSKMRAFAQKFPRLRVIYGHEPSQWTDKARVNLEK